MGLKSGEIDTVLLILKIIMTYFHLPCSPCSVSSQRYAFLDHHKLGQLKKLW